MFLRIGVLLSTRVELAYPVVIRRGVAVLAETLANSYTIALRLFRLRSTTQTAISTASSSTLYGSLANDARTTRQTRTKS